MRKHAIWNNFQYDGVGITADTHPVNQFKKVADDDVKFKSSKAFWDREEQQPTTVSVSDFSPVVGEASTDVVLEREVNILTFSPAEGDAKAVLGSSFADPFTMESGFTSGWARLVHAVGYNVDTENARYTLWTDGAVVPAESAANRYNGVPTMGFAAIRGNTGIEGKDVGETVPHAFIRVRGN
jgi:hypothetical protein